MQLIYFGSGAFGLPTLERLHADHQVLAVVTQPDKPAGRKRHLTPTPVAAWAEARKLAVMKIEDVNVPEFIARIALLAPEASVVIAFGQKLAPELVAAMGKLAMNLHSSLLPRFRGAAPINWAMIHNEPVTGVSVISLAQRMDAGVVYASDTLPIDPLETAGELHDRLALLGPGVVMDVLRRHAEGTLKPMEQDHAAATRAPKFKKADGTVDFNQPAALARARVHGLTPWPGCRVGWKPTPDATTQPVTLLRVKDHDGGESASQSNPPGTIRQDGRIACASGVLEVLELQVPGGKAVTFEEFKRGHPWLPGGLVEAWRFE